MTQRTGQQNNSLHLSFRQFADELNGAGYTIREAIRLNLLHFDLPWNEENIKDIFKVVMKHQYPTKQWEDPDNPSTTELSTTELSQCWEIMNLAMGERFGVTLPFPSQESLSEAQR